MIKMSLSQVASVLNLSYDFPNLTVQGISIDSRTLQPDNLFIAIQGEQFDGHQFIDAAYKKGAKALLVSHPVNSPLPQIIVKDTIQALGKISQWWRNQFNIPFVGITGSNGKTTVKNMIAAILAEACSNTNAVLATPGNLNNHLGLPLTLAKLDTHHEFGVLEMGMNHFGEIAYLAALARPHVAVITNAAESHLEGVHSVAGVAKAKGEIFSTLTPRDIAILNRDDAFFEYWKEVSALTPQLTFGLNPQADVSYERKSEGILLRTPYGNISVNLPLLGMHNIMNALAATAATIALQIDLHIIKKGLEKIKPAPGRMQEYILADGIRIIDDTYNANPFSLEAAIHTLKSYTGEKILVLGDMKELGANADTMHFNAGIKIRDAGIDHLFALGQLTKKTAEGFGKEALYFTEHQALLRVLKPYLKTKVTILVKGSRSMHMEKILMEIIPTFKSTYSH